MNYPSIRVEGAILSPDIFDQIEELPGQKPSDFGLDNGMKVKDEIARCYADAKDYWRIFQRKLDSLREGSNATTETRNQWMLPLMGLLRYDIEYQARGTEINGRIYAISHHATNRAKTPFQIIGAHDPAGLDKKPVNAARRMSAHALIQEYLNLHDQLYGLVTDGKVLRLLRDSSRLVKQSYLEFDLDRIFTDGLFADFAILYRLLHATRLPLTIDKSAESLIERYHQDSLDQGARIRKGLSNAVERAILDFANGFLKHADNHDLRAAVASGKLSASDYYQQLLRLIYRLLFLMVIEERDLVFPADAPKSNRDIHRDYYSVTRLRRLSEHRYLADPRRCDLWLALLACFRLFEADGPGTKLGIAPLAGDLFAPKILGLLTTSALGNDVLLGCLRSLSLYRHPETGNLIRVNYAALNVEEFGSVYEGLLEYKPKLLGEADEWRFQFLRGEERAASGSHYTPEDLVQPLIRHSLDHLIAECLEAKDPEAALLGLRVADIACGSGHILLAAARRIATELAVVRTSEEQPSPTAYRTALRDAITQCIYGVDVNPLAVELCKVALWLEAHIPGKPLNFLDHHIKCGNAIVGFAHREEVDQGMPMEAFKTQLGDDKEVAAIYRNRNKEELKHQKQTPLDFSPELRGHLETVLNDWRQISTLPEQTPAQIDEKKARFTNFAEGQHAELLRNIADIPIAQFFTPKVPINKHHLVTDSEFRQYWRGGHAPQGPGANAARELAAQHRFFHWFLEFPEIMDRGGFDCILGNPPYLGRKALSGTFGHGFCELVKWKYSPAGLSDLVVYFLRRIHDLIRDGGFTAIITTNSIIDGDVRKDSLEQIVAKGGQINMAVRGVRWPGAANLVVSLLAIHKGEWSGLKMLDDQPVQHINTFFEEGVQVGEPNAVAENRNSIYQGSIFLGDGFLLTHDEADQLRASDSRNADVIMPIINGKELNNNPDQAPGRSIINFRDWPLEKAQAYHEPFSIVEEKVKPFRATQNRKRNREVWWVYAEHRPGLIRSICDLPRCFAAAATTKYLSFSPMPTDYVFTNALYVLTTDRWDIFGVVQSTLHEVWARKYSGSLKQDLRYSPSKCFESFTFPSGLWQVADSGLAGISECYHVHRKELMLSLSLGLTKIYNLFHARNMSPEMVAKISKKEVDIASAGYEALIKLRSLHMTLDIAVRDAYGWHDLDLEHGFHEVETLPENDRIRFTVSQSVSRELLKRLLAENLYRTKSKTNNLLTTEPKCDSVPEIVHRR